LSREFVAVLIWALFLAGLTLAQLAFMSETYSFGLLGGAALVTLVLGMVLLVRRRRAGEAPRELPELSYPTIALAVGIAVTLLGIPFGEWLLLPGLGLIALGAGGLVLERRVGA
jgi:hypothetical protein